MSKNKAQADSGSFRDPSGVIFTRGEILLRQVNMIYQKQYDALIQSGLYKKVTDKGQLIRHIESSEEPFVSELAYKILQPERIPFISYPYEWSFGQLKDAALLTLQIHKEALNADMILKDASAYNIQFIKGRPVLIDSLSFDFYKEGYPWVAYGQFCRHFLAPLLLMVNIDLRLNQLLRTNIDGIPLDLAAGLLHGKGGFLATQHIRWHAKAIQKHGQDGKVNQKVSMVRISKFQHVAMIDSLLRGIEKLQLRKIQTEWGDYYANTNYDNAAAEKKDELVRKFLGKKNPASVWDMGANDGRYSKLALDVSAESVVAFDIDAIAVERNYQSVKNSQISMLPLIFDITNPSPGIGFANRERKTILERQKPDCIMALALVHHLAISNNLPLEMLAEWFATMCYSLIIEFVPKEDSQVEILLSTREDIFPHYTQNGFEKAFAENFKMLEKENVEGSTRCLYLFEKRD